MTENHPRFLVYTRDDDRRERLARHFADQADGRIVTIQKAEHVERLASQYEILGAVIDINSHDRTVRSVMKAIRSATWLRPPAIVYLYDDTESTLGFMVEERADWLSRRLSNREVVRRLLESAGTLEAGNTEGQRLQEIILSRDVDDAEEFDSGEAIQALSANLRGEFRSALDAIEAELDSGRQIDVGAIALSLERSAAMLDKFDIGPVTSELLTSSVDDPTERVLRDAIHRLRGVSNELPARAPLIAFVSTDEELVRQTADDLQDCLVEQIPTTERLAEVCDHRCPDVIVIIDSEASMTGRTLQLLRYLRRVNPVPILVKLQIDREGLGEAADYGVTTIVDKEADSTELAREIRAAAERSVANRPSALILDVDRTLAPHLVPALDQLGISTRVIHRVSALQTSAKGVDIIYLAADYQRLSGIDASRAISNELRMLRPPVVLLAEETQEAHTRRHAFQIGVDDVISVSASTEELARRSRLLIENYHLRRSAAESDAMTGVNHICGLSRLLGNQIGEQASEWASMLMVDIDSFSLLRESYGESAGRSVLRSLADHLSTIFPVEHIFRDWTDRFIIVGPHPYQTEDDLDDISKRLLAFKKITFRSNDGRGFYVTVTVAHLLVPSELVAPQLALEKLVRILDRAKSQSRGGFLSATMEPDTYDRPSQAQPAPGTKGKRWEPVVLTRQDD